MHGHFNIDTLALRTDINFGFAVGVENSWMKHGFGFVDVLNKPSHASCERKFFFLGLALIDQPDSHAIVQKRQLTQALGQNLVVKTDVSEDVDIRQKMHFSAALVGCAGHLHG